MRVCMIIGYRYPSSLVKEKYTWDKVVEEYIKLYEKLINEGP